MSIRICITPEEAKLIEEALVNFSFFKPEESENLQKIHGVIFMERIYAEINESKEIA